jgi:hypothetical protein
MKLGFIKEMNAHCLDFKILEGRRSRVFKKSKRASVVIPINLKGSNNNHKIG